MPEEKNYRRTLWFFVIAFLGIVIVRLLFWNVLPRGGHKLVIGAAVLVAGAIISTAETMFQQPDADDMIGLTREACIGIALILIGAVLMLQGIIMI